MSTVVLEGLQASNDKIKNKGFTFMDNDLQDAFKNLGKF